MPIRVLVVDDHAFLRMGVTALLTAVPGLEVVGEAGDVASAQAEARRLRPDVVVMDLRLPDGTGVEACRAIRSELPATRVLMLTTYAEERAVVDALVAGAAGYVLKDAPPARLVEAIEQVAAGGSLLDPGIAQGLVDFVQRRSGDRATGGPLDALTLREQQVLDLIAEGRTNRQIADALKLSEHTVKDHVGEILHKLGLARRAQAAALVARLGR